MCRICPRSGFCTSTFCPQAGHAEAVTTRKERLIVFTSASPILIYGHMGAQEALRLSLLDGCWFTMKLLLALWSCSCHLATRTSSWSAVLRWRVGECR